MMQVIATAGHVDHGKSTLIRALTGIEPDRWEEEKRRGLTIDLGFAWTTLPSGQEIAFVDVPGHERFLGNMLAGIGPAPIVCFVVAADEGWQAQSDDHRDAIAALGIDQGVIAITRADLAPDRVEAVTAQVRAQLVGTGLADAPAVSVSARTGDGLDELRTALDDAVARSRRPEAADRIRLWVDRSFTIAGAGSVVTGTLTAGTLSVGQTLELRGADHSGPVTVRGLQSRGGQARTLEPVTRAAVNLRGIDHEAISRGDALLTPNAWELTGLIDVRGMTGQDLGDAPEELVAHVGTAAVAVRVRPLGARHARLTLDRPLPLTVGDRLVLRGSGSRSVYAGAQVLDVDPPALDRRGDGERRRQALEEMPLTGDAAGEVARRGAIREEVLRRRGLVIPDPLPAATRREGAWLVDAAALERWTAGLRRGVLEHAEKNPLAAGLPARVARDMLRLPDESLLEPVVTAAGLQHRDGLLTDPQRAQGMGAAEAGIAALEERLRKAPFHAPEAEDLTALGLGSRELAAAERQGRVLRLPDGVVLLPTAPALAMRELAGLSQPFTTSQARQALDTTRRVAIPLLEHLDARGWTRRVDAGHREIAR